MFVADDLGAWLIGLFADSVRRNLTTLVLGDELDRAVRSPATAAIDHTAAELCPGDSQAAMVINEVFGAPISDALLAQHTTLLRALETGIAQQLAVLDDASLAGNGPVLGGHTWSSGWSDRRETNRQSGSADQSGGSTEAALWRRWPTN